MATFSEASAARLKVMDYVRRKTGHVPYSIGIEQTDQGSRLRVRLPSADLEETELTSRIDGVEVLYDPAQLSHAL